MSARLLTPHIVGVRHLSPSGACAVQATLERVQPSVVCVEAPAGLEPQMRHLADPRTRPPVALLVYSKAEAGDNAGTGVRSLVYPLASYSPEWVAVRWALEHDRELVFIDLPPGVFLGLPSRAPEFDRGPSPLQRFATQAGAADVESWWEQWFEHRSDASAYVQAAFALGEGLRQLESEDAADRAENMLREAFMRRLIHEAMAGRSPDEVVVVCGAFHAPALTTGEPAMTDADLDALPRLQCVATLMPYSYERLHARSGYGAGNRAPSYYEALYLALQADRLQDLPAQFLVRVADHMRTAGYLRSSAQVIDAVSLAHALAAMRSRPAITLDELRDAASTCFGDVDRRPVHEALDVVETAHAIGSIPSEVLNTAFQRDFRRQLERFKLHPAEGSESIVLDLRENLRAKTPEVAFFGRNRSIFLHRCRVCGIDIATKQEEETLGHSSWKERWVLQWSPEAEMRVAELSLRGDSVAEVAGVLLGERLERSATTAEAASVLREAAHCDIAGAIADALARLQAVATQDDALISLAAAVHELFELARYGGVRTIDAAPLWPLIEQVFRRGVMVLPAACNCDTDLAPPTARAIATLAAAAAAEPERVPTSELLGALHGVALGDGGNPFVVGSCAALLLERGLSEAELARALTRRLSPGADVELAAGFFEGLASHNKMALFSRRIVWEQLSAFVDNMSGEELLRAIVPLRRTFSTFSPGELRRVVSALDEVWQGGSEELAVAVESAISGLSTADLDALNDELGDLDF